MRAWTNRQNSHDQSTRLPVYASHVGQKKRTDLVDAEKAEVTILSAYLPARMGDAEIEKEINAVVAETGASGAKDMGKVMAALKSRLAGKADMGKVSALVKSRLSG